jgi:YesN/AraC family two-component response regulator
MKKKILVVEDESLIARDLKNILEEEGYEVIVNINTVLAAIDCIEKNELDLVLIDINLNQLQDGIDLGHYLLARNTIPYIYVTSYANKLTLEKAQDTRPYAYIVKPFRPEAIVTTVSVVLNNFKFKKIDTIRDETSKNELNAKKLKQVVTFINDNIDKNIELDELLKETHWTKRHLTRVFMQYLKITPYQFILNKKIEKAKMRLRETNIPINEIAFELGFENYRSFFHNFKKIANEAPENYRQKNY